jgi:PTS system galactitol-specific IIC component
MDRLFDSIPGIRKLGWNPSRPANENNENTRNGANGGNGGSGAFRLLGEPMVIGVLVGLFLSLLAGYGIRQTLETAVNIAAVMFLLPRCGGLIGEGMGEIALEFKNLVERKFPSLKGLSIAMDTGILMTNRSVIATGLILIPVSLLIAFVLPGNRVLPLGDLPNLISIMSLTVLVLRGNVIRSVLAGIPIVATFLLVASRMAPVFTALAAKTGMSAGGAGEITAFTDGGNQIRYWFYWLFQGNILAFAVIPVVLAMLGFAWRTHRKMI